MHDRPVTVTLEAEEWQSLIDAALVGMATLNDRGIETTDIALAATFVTLEVHKASLEADRGEGVPPDPDARPVTSIRLVRDRAAQVVA